ncbi:hypothetical protein ACO1O0_008831 [Amphichorda felina]
MDANQSGDSSPLSSIGDKPPSSPPQAVKSPPAASEVCQDVPPSSSRGKRSRVMSPRRQPVKKAAPKRPPKKSKWDAENIITDPKSPLGSADLRSLLSSPMAWDSLDADEKAEILALFPDQSQILSPGTETARPDVSALRNDDTFRHDCATYTEHVAQGRFDPEWLACAWTAYERRKMGDFDEHLNNKFEEDWQVDLPEDFRPKRALPSAGEKEGGGEDQTADSKDAIEQPTKTENSKKEEEGQKSDDHLNHTKDAIEDPTKTENSKKEERQKSVDHFNHTPKGSTTKAEGERGERGSQPQTDSDNMMLDELQAEAKCRRLYRRPMVRIQSTRMEIDGEESEDELA